MNETTDNQPYEDLDDHALMELCRTGDERAFHQIYERHAENIMGYVIKFCGDEHIAADVTQETFEYLFRKVEDYEPEAPLSSLLYKVARNTCYKKLRSKRKESNMDLNWDDLETTGSTNAPDEQVHGEERKEHIQRTIQQLPEHVREVVILRVMEGLKYREISNIVEVPLGTVKSRLHDGLDRLRDRLRQTIGDLTEIHPNAE